MDITTIGKRLRAVRESSGFTQEHVARYLGV
ncbi:MAG: helix-turn-helix transcriptional regulator, partial [Dehalococcoidia bacterium]|nr:helix-turn-helix transcriptional regulator [Dehalococcoidia bacterium]